MAAQAYTSVLILVLDSFHLGAVARKQCFWNVYAVAGLSRKTELYLGLGGVHAVNASSGGLSTRLCG